MSSAGTFSTLLSTLLTTEAQTISEYNSLPYEVSTPHYFLTSTTSKVAVETIDGEYESATYGNLGNLTSLHNVYDNRITTMDYTNATWSPEECALKFHEFKVKANLQFVYMMKVRVLLTWIVFLISALGNLFVLTSLTIRRRRKHISHPQLMMLHLTFANLAFTFFILPADAIWHTTMEWYGGDMLCRLVNVLKQFAMYISSAMIVVMGIDRVTSLMCPLSPLAQRQRISIMLAIAWIFSLLNAIPAGVIFSVITHTQYPQCPTSTITQCVDMNISMGADLDVYYVYTMFISFFGPLICILICYLFIALSISKMAKISKEAQKRLALRQRGSNKSVTGRGLDRARRISLIVTGLITFTFVVCWGPYYVVGLIQWSDKPQEYPQNATSSDSTSEPAKPPDMSAHVFMLMSMYLNPMLHPLITLLLMKEVRDNVLSQCRNRPDSFGRKPISNKKPAEGGALVKMDNNGTAELIPNKNGSDRARRQWV